MTTLGTKSNAFVDCLLAMEDAGIQPGPKISSNSILLAFLLSMRSEGEPEEPRPLTEIFVDELNKIIADPRPLTTQEIIAQSKEVIDFLKGVGSSRALKKVAVIELALLMLRTNLKKEAINN